MIRILKIRFSLRRLKYQSRESRKMSFWRSLNGEIGQLENPDIVSVPLSPESAEESIRDNFTDSLQQLFWDRISGSELLAPALPREGRSDVRFELLSIRYSSLEFAVLVSASAAFFKFADEHEEALQIILESLSGEALDNALGVPASEQLNVQANLSRSGLARAGDTPAGSLLARVLVIYKPLIPILVALALLWTMGYNMYLDAREDKKAVQTVQKDLLDRQQKMIQLENARILSLEAKFLASPVPLVPIPSSLSPSPSAAPAQKP
jgi:hypothetical protein